MENREEILNELMFLTKQKEELWAYHPYNPNRIDMVKVYNKISNDIEKLEGLL